jgi:hypothetical protein
MRAFTLCLLALGFVTANGLLAIAQGNVGPSAVNVPLTMVKYGSTGTYKADLEVGVGKLCRLPIVFDTGSTGLVLFAVPHVGDPSSGTRCTRQPFSVTYGNPGRITYSGVVCSGKVDVGGLTTARRVPFALLTSASCPPTNPGCTLTTPQQLYRDGDYGIFGASLALGETIPNPLRVLPGSYGQRFAVRVTPTAGELVLGGPYFKGVVFPLVPEGSGALGIAGYRSGYECVVVNGSASEVCAETVYDTGNGVPFFYAYIRALSVMDGYVSPGTNIGFTPPYGSPVAAAATLVASNTFAGQFRVEPNEDQVPLINVGIQGFLGHEVGFDSVRELGGYPGVMTIAPG